MTLRRVCVFCGSSSGADPAFAATTARLGALLASRGIGLVYGGGSVGLMGVLADAVLQAGGHVIGVIPSALVLKEVAHHDLPDLRIVATMHERKALMAELADGFVALPGGLGTLDELFETLTWAQLGLHHRPCGLLDTGGYYRPLLAFLDRAVEAGFLRAQHRGLLLVDEDPERLLDRLAQYSRPAETDKRIDAVRA
jgi:uncharacterized protein (TIGR00730 family)